MTYKRKTQDVWHIDVNYGQGWEHETTELTRASMVENRKAYRENCQYPIRVRSGRMLIEDAV